MMGEETDSGMPLKGSPNDVDSCPSEPELREKYLGPRASRPHTSARAKWGRQPRECQALCGRDARGPRYFSGGV
jgi:hypothetical protein